MEIFPISLTETDIISIRSALRLWGKSFQIVEGYDNAQINKHFELWARFVQSDWRDWDISEYDHDIGSRYWIQIAIDYSTPQTHNILEKAVQPIDEIFMAKMKPCAIQRQSSKMPQAGQPYFWETNTIYPE